MIESIVYGWKNVRTDFRYVGYHKLKDGKIEDRYTSSSTSPEFWDAFTRGELVRSVLFGGKDQPARGVESALMTELFETCPDKVYNVTNNGTKKGLVHVTEDMLKVGKDWINGIDPIVEEYDVGLDISIIEDVEASLQERTITEFCTKELSDNLEYYQVREKVLDQNHVTDLADKMRANGWKDGSRIIVLVDGKNKHIISGNHRAHAAKRAKLAFAHVVFVYMHEFNNDWALVDLFSTRQNPVEDGSPTTENDGKFQVKKFYYRKYRKADNSFKILKSETFKQEAKQLLQMIGFTNPHKIGQMISNAKKEIKRDIENELHNIQTYSGKEKNTVRDYFRIPGVRGAITTTVNNLYSAGKGIILTHDIDYDMYETTIIVSVDNYSDLEELDKQKQRLMKALSVINNRVAASGIEYKLDVYVLDHKKRDSLLESE